MVFSQKMAGDGRDPPPSNACVCVREKQGRKIKTQNEGGGERNQINARIYAPALPGEVCQVELDLVPAVVQPHGHRANERLHSTPQNSRV